MSNSVNIGIRSSVHLVRIASRVREQNVWESGRRADTQVRHYRLNTSHHDDGTRVRGGRLTAIRLFFK